MLRRMTAHFNDTIYFISADGLKCYQCFSTSSWGDCSQKEVTCASEWDTCAKVYVKVKKDDVSVTEYAKTCSTQEICDAKDSALCKGEISGERCDINCCNTDLCNTAAIQVINVIFLVLCAFLALVLMQ